MEPRRDAAGLEYCGSNSDVVYPEYLYVFSPVYFPEKRVQGRIMRTGKHSLQGKDKKKTNPKLGLL